MRVTLAFALALLCVCSSAAAQNSPVTLRGTVASGDGGDAGGDGVCHDGWAACNVWHHDQQVKGKYRLAAMECYSSLGRALDWEDQAFEINEQLRRTTGRAREPLLDEFNEKILMRSMELEAHRQCIQDWFLAHPGPLDADADQPTLTSEQSEPTWAEKLDEALGGIPYLQETDKFLADISDFDMTKPHTGAKVVAESALNLLGEAGFSYLAKGAQALIARAAASGAKAGAGAAASAAEGAASAAASGAANRAAGAAGEGAAATRAAAGAAAESAAGSAAGGAGQRTTGGALGNAGRDAAREVGPPPRYQPPRSQYTDAQPPMYDPQGIQRIPEVDAPPPPTSIGEHIIPEQVWAAQLPPGTQIPAAITSLPRPVYLQESTHSCVLACSKMISETHLGASFPEQTLERMVRAMNDPAYVPGVGVVPEQMQSVLWQAAGIDSRFATNVTIDELRAATANGAPAMVALNGSHAVVVDGIIDTATGPMVLVRDPANLGLLHPELAADNAVRAGFLSAPAIPLKEFMLDFFHPDTQFGSALLTRLP
jgi:hypothetical protein